MLGKGLLLAAAVAMPGVATAQYLGGGAPPPPAAPAAGVTETPEAALARNVRVLAGSPRDYDALLRAGRAALALGDAQAAVGFFGRAEEVHPVSWAPKVGQGAALVQLLEPTAALRAFDEAQRRGATLAILVLDRGLAYDLLGDQPRAQADYRAALNGTDPYEARRRLALSLGIGGRKAEALATLDPLLIRREPAALRTRALVLALSGDANGAKLAFNSAMPGAAATMEPFFRRLPALRPGEKAAAVHFGYLPGRGGTVPPASIQVAGPTTVPPASAQVAGPATADPDGDRLADIDRLLKAGEPTPQPQAPPTRAVAIAGNTATSPAVRAATPRRHWVQLASGTDQEALAEQFRRIKSRNGDLLEGISGYVAEEASKARLLIGPFRNDDDARVFADDLQTVNVDSFLWTSAPGQQVRKLP